MPVDSAIAAFGRIDVLINNAGQGIHNSIEELALDDVRALLELNLVAPLTLIKAVIPGMRDQESRSIVNVSSGTTFGLAPGTGGDVASKIALERLSAIARNELQWGRESQVSTILPFVTHRIITSLRAGRSEAAEGLTEAQFDSP